MSEERKLVTVLFADIVGSTASGKGYDPEVVRTSLRKTFDAAADVLVAHGATVEKFIGDAIMAVFGVPRAHDDDADRALHAAFALRERVRELNAERGPQYRLRIGVASGEAVTGSGASDQFLVTGEVVNAAARLEQSAEPDEILVGSLTRKLASAAVRFGPARDVAAKGLGQLDAAPADAVSSALPSEPRRGLPGLRAPLIGRDLPLRQLLAERARAREEGRARIVTVVGAPGIGKSRLALEFADALGGAGVRRGRSLPYGQAITYYALGLILREDAGILPGDSRETAAAKLRSAVVGAIDDPTEGVEGVLASLSVLAGLAQAEEALPDVPPDELKHEFRWALRRYFERRAENEALVLILEDIHWAEPALLDLIEHVAESTRAPLFILCLARPDLLEARPAWGSGGGRSLVIRLEPLTPADTRRLVSELLVVDALPETLRTRVVDHAEGNPLYVEEFLRMLMDSGAIARSEGNWVVRKGLTTLAIPPTLQALIASRLDHLPPALKELLQRAAVVGRSFSTAALGALAEPGEPFIDAIFDAVRRDLLIEAAERGAEGGWIYRFKHVLIRDAAYAALPKAERSALHDRYGRWLEERHRGHGDEVIDIIAFHADEAFTLANELGSPDALALGRRSFSALIEAGAKARTRADDRAARRFYARASAVTMLIKVTALERSEAAGFAAIGRSILEGVDANDEMDQALALARAAGPSEVHLALLLRLVETGRLGYMSQTVASATAHLNEAVEVARATADPQLIAEALFASGTTFDMEARERVYSEALSYARAAGVSRVVPPILIGLVHVRTQRGDFTGARALLDEAKGLAESSGSKFHRARWAAEAMLVAWALRDTATAVARAEESLALAREINRPSDVGFATAVLAINVFESGDLDRARLLAEEALSVYTPGMASATAWPHFVLARVYVDLGDVRTAREHALACLANATDDWMRGLASSVLGHVCEAEGKVLEAERLYRAGVELVARNRAFAHVAYAREQFIRFLIAHGRGSEARPLLEENRRFYSDPLARAKREEMELLLRNCNGVSSVITGTPK